MNLHNRIDKLLNTVRPMAETKRRAKRTARLKGATMETICNAVENAVDPQDMHILDEICYQIQEYEAQPSYKYRAYEKEREHIYVHGLTQWLLLLRDGVAALPDRLPRSVLEAWRDRYVSKWGPRGEPWCPHPFWRCMDCAMVLPHGDGGWSAPCPVCGSARVWHSNFGYPLGVAWIDPRPVRRGAACE